MLSGLSVSSGSPCERADTHREEEGTAETAGTEMGLDGKAGAPLHQSLPSRLVLVLPFQEDETPSLALAHSPKYMLSGMGWDMGERAEDGEPLWSSDPFYSSLCDSRAKFSPWQSNFSMAARSACSSPRSSAA